MSQARVKSILKSKTVLTGVLAVIGAITGGATGDLGTADAIQLFITGLMGIFLRHSINKQATGDL